MHLTMDSFVGKSQNPSVKLTTNGLQSVGIQSVAKPFTDGYTDFYNTFPYFSKAVSYSIFLMFILYFDTCKVIFTHISLYSIILAISYFMVFN